MLAERVVNNLTEISVEVSSRLTFLLQVLEAH